LARDFGLITVNDVEVVFYFENKNGSQWLPFHYLSKL
jgi:hypothetical protein